MHVSIAQNRVHLSEKKDPIERNVPSCKTSFSFVILRILYLNTKRLIQQCITEICRNIIFQAANIALIINKGTAETEFTEFEPWLKFKPRLKYCEFHLKLYSMFQDLSPRSIETGFWWI